MPATLAPVSRALVPLSEGAAKPLTIELLQKAGELQSSIQLNGRALAGPASESAHTKLERKREILTGLRALLDAEYGRSTAALKPLLFAQRVSSEDRVHIARALGELSQEQLAELPPEQLAKTFTSVAKMVNSRESDARNFANQRMVKAQRDRPLTSPADVHKCAYGLMNIALAEAVEDEDLAQHRLDRRDQAGVDPAFQPTFRAECMAKFRSAMDAAIAAREGHMTPAQIDAVVNRVIRQIKKDNPPPPKLPDMDPTPPKLPDIEAWKEAHEALEAKHRASVPTAWGPAQTASASSTSTSSAASAAASGAASPAVPSSAQEAQEAQEAQKARRQKLGLDFD